MIRCPTCCDFLTLISARCSTKRLVRSRVAISLLSFNYWEGVANMMDVVGGWWEGGRTADRRMMDVMCIQIVQTYFSWRAKSVRKLLINRQR